MSIQKLKKHWQKKEKIKKEKRLIIEQQAKYSKMTSKKNI
jgi:hypothetical protein